VADVVRGMMNETPRDVVTYGESRARLPGLYARAVL